MVNWEHSFQLLNFSDQYLYIIVYMLAGYDITWIELIYIITFSNCLTVIMLWWTLKLILKQQYIKWLHLRMHNCVNIVSYIYNLIRVSYMSISLCVNIVSYIYYLIRISYMSISLCVNILSYIYNVIRVTYM